ncbi:MAG: ATP synthase F1 subunit epsilon [Pseudomonadota bacterium]|nr:ATP synthase F1 subunit epsilon [Pseudomonadota bacterium]
MAGLIQLELVTPEELVFSNPVEFAVIPGSEGDFGVLPGHAPFVSELRTGVLKVYKNGQVDKRLFVSAGFAELTNEKCVVLADEAIEVEFAKIEDIEKRIEENRIVIKEARDEVESARASAALKISEALLSEVEAKKVT